MNHDMKIIQGNRTFEIALLHEEIIVTELGDMPISIPIGAKGLRRVGKALVGIANLAKVLYRPLEPLTVYQHPDGHDIQILGGDLVVGNIDTTINVPLTRRALKELGKSMVAYSKKETI